MSAGKPDLDPSDNSEEIREIRLLQSLLDRQNADRSGLRITDR